MEQRPLIDSQDTIPTSQPLQIPTPTGPAKIDMTFISSLIASTGALLFSCTVWYILYNAEYSYFVWHPTLMSLVLFMSTQGILVLQTAVRKEEKEVGLNWHKVCQSVAFLSVIGGFVIIYTHKNSIDKEHFASPHGKFGIFTFVYLLLQSIGGSTVLNFPGLVGGQEKARAIYKYHRFSGYILLPLIYLTALGGTQTDWVRSHFDHIVIWLFAIGLVFSGIYFRSKTNKIKFW